MTRVPDLGPRGEGWVLVQFVLLGGIVLAGLAGLPGAGWSGAIRIAQVGLGSLAIGFGALLALGGVIALGRSLSPFPSPTEANRLVESGVYRYVRHPVYAGIVLASFGWGLVAGSLLAIALALLLLGWFDLKARREEAWLAARHPDYAAYRTRTRKFLPFLY